MLKMNEDELCEVLDTIVQMVGKYVPESEKGAIEELLLKIEEL